jgi:hypothetical protein
MATVTIYISKQADGTGLHLTDSEGHSGDNNLTTTANPGDKVIWQLKAGGGIDQITSITPKENSQDVFSTDPAPVDSGNPASDWAGIVSTSASGNESYSIGYKIGDTDYTDDPQLDVNT